MDGMTLLLLGLLLVLLIKLVVVDKKYAGNKAPPLRLPPGPWQLPVIGSLHHLLLLAWRHGGLLHRAVRELSGRHGPVMLLRLGAVPTLVMSSPEAAREVLKTHDAAFASRHLTPTMDVLSMGGRDILFSPYGELWRQLRRICVLELFSARRVQSFRRIREEEAGRLFNSVADSCAAGSAVVDIGERVCRAMNDIVVRSAVGGRCARRDEFLHELHRAVVLTSGFNFVDLYPSSRLVRRLSRALRETEQCIRNVRDIMGEIIREQQQLQTTGGVQDKEEDNLLAVLLRLQRDGDAQCPLTTDVITSVVQEIFAAGSETSSTTLEWALSELTRNPPAMSRAQAAVRDAFKGQQMLTEAEMPRLSYLPLVVKETLRLHLPVPFLLPRECRETCRVMGYDVPRGTKVLVNAWAIARDAAYWGGRPRGVPAGAVRGRRRRRRLQRRRLRVHPVRRRQADVPRHGAGARQHGAGARWPPLPLRLDAPGRRREGTGHERGVRDHREEEVQARAARHATCTMLILALVRVTSISGPARQRSVTAANPIPEPGSGRTSTSFQDSGSTRHVRWRYDRAVCFFKCHMHASPHAVVHAKSNHNLSYRLCHLIYS